MAQLVNRPLKQDSARNQETPTTGDSQPDEPPPLDLLLDGSLFLDFDGTLVEIVERPDAVAVDRRLATLMSRLADRLQGRLAVVSGRPRAEIDALFGGDGFAVGGSHGLELRWPDGRMIAPATPAGLTEIAAQMRALVNAQPGIFIEEKPFGIALHYRGAPDAAADCHALAKRLAGQFGFALQTGKMVVELRAAGGDKGAALRAFMAEPPMRGTRPLFVGDDLTDEDAFAAASALGGHGILVGPPRASAAHYRLPDVAAVRAWLESAEEALA
jgi:trehalose 6-phosphate phosphatase